MANPGRVAKARGGVGLIVGAGLFFLLVSLPLLARQLTQFYPPINDSKRPTMWKGVVAPAAGLLLSSLGLAGSASATLLYASSYAGTVTTLSLTLPDGESNVAATNAAGATLKAVSSSTECGPNPSWLALDYSKSFLYCLDEGWAGPYGGVYTFSAPDEGSLSLLNKLDLIQGPVSIAQYGVEGHGLAIAQYSGSAVSAVNAGSEGELSLVFNETYALAGPGTNPSRQEAPHPHQAILDPTSSYVLVPDLGADLVRIYRANAKTLQLTPIAPLAVTPGSGPRHGVFTVARRKTYFYLVSELTNTITGYEVIYQRNKTLGFNELFTISTHGDDSELPSGTGAAEIAISPDDRFLIVSSRWENSFNIPNFDSSNSTEIPSDPIITFSINRGTGALAKVQEFAAGGRGPRHFSLNAAGDLAAVALQADGRVVVIARDVETGEFQDYVAHASVEGEVNAVIFREEF
ncbi:putative isomerase YbhE [Durotheca rogersii]|uniref:putative isomerase YbhE n=1 Tax=Durotheca rogersii TaxID=419775 RepID=UPI002220AAEA|nr:putative isomerase YbhE [Durotheca rogersii]KAI5868369.1 putative isomerase YbhE [Durotheca rogersii]